MKNKGSNSGVQALLAGGLMLSVLVPLGTQAQTLSSVPDAEVEANVLKALAAAPELATQDIQSATVYGVVTLSGTVQTEVLRTRAEDLVARATGVKKVVDELTLGTPSATSASNTGEDSSAQTQDNQPVLQSDGSYAPAAPSQPATPYEGSGAPQGNATDGQAYPNPTQQPNPNQSSYPAQAGTGQPAYGQDGYGQPSSSGSNTGQAPAYAGSYNPRSAQGYSGQQSVYGPPRYAPPGGQQAGIPVTVPVGALLRVRINRGLDSNHSQPGTSFDGTVLSDVAADGAVAIPRGAAVQGVVVDAKKAGVFKGEGELALQINSVTLGGTSYPLTSDLWQREGNDKSVRTVNSALGLGVLGAIVGGVAGGGAGAAVGAGVGAGAGVAGSAASPGGRVIVPPEAVLVFHVAQPSPVHTVSEQEMQRLSYAAGPGAGPGYPVVRRRYYAPYYGQAPYPYPYYPYR